MISTDLQRVQIQDVVEHQLPAFVRNDFPLIADFLKQYYISQEYPGASADLIQNIDEYLKLESLTNTRESTTLASAVGYDVTTLTVTFDLGKDIFLNAGNCGACHSLKDANAVGNVGPNLNEIRPDIGRVMNSVTNGIGVMPAFEGMLTPEEIEAIAYFVSTSSNK